ncbi:MULTISPECIES: O-antigen ligase family protein [unclassified Lysobacter]|uniref:O-antigen ligase family protein n=1 Tax=unclassified Lysobacter TaxID=2635362 RepID=UPI001BE8F6E8|nr:MULTISPECIES: O-antigen ligase family protein [unclassified Lysobacter]MBT2747485.1 O-antigen ligase family protein [Lysobacter sp. ISL-42]MBT2752731.1 O-antigen ligase family protein [Lysobacter sp. ISL-50]MBT2778388.1 O-antigen ligase family protein [Lysobacter sp. ISL-54]MBT2783906.1 O-antigen ligase family protein [Lysobacter sp. ISL-52]
MNKPAVVVGLALALVGSLLGADLRARLRGALRDPFVRGCLLWWAVTAISAVHAGWEGDWRQLSSSRLWLFCYPLILASVLTDARWRWRALAGFMLAATLVLAASYAMQFGLLPQRELVAAAPSMRNTVFKEYTQQGLAWLMLGSMAVSIAFCARSRALRLAAFALALAVLVAVTLLLQSRTAYLVLAPLIAYWLWRWIRAHRSYPRWAAATAGIAVAAVAVALVLNAPPVEQRLVSSVPDEVRSYRDSQAPTSAGVRLRLWQDTLPIVAAAPLFGHGLGQWRPQHESRTAGEADAESFWFGHPHQEFLLILSEQGGAGLAILLVLIAALSRRIATLPDPQRGFFACVVLIYLSAGLFNGLWSDFTHRHTFLLLLACIPALAARETGAEAAA